MSRPFLVEDPKLWFRYWWHSLRSSWRIVALIVFGALPFLGFWRDELGSSEWSKTLHVLAVISTIPTSWLIILFLCVLLAMTVEGALRSAITSQQVAGTRTSSLEKTISELRQSLEAAQSVLRAPHLSPEILEYTAEENGTPVAWDPNYSGNVFMMMGVNRIENTITMKVKLRISNDSHAETAVRQDSIALHLFEYDHENTGDGQRASTAAGTLYEIVRYAMPVEGVAVFTLKDTTATHIVRKWFTVSVIDGKGTVSHSRKHCLGHVRPPLKKSAQEGS